MPKIPEKYRNFLQLLVKLSIVIGAFYFIYKRIILNDKVDFSELIFQIKSKLFQNYYTVFFLLGFTVINWFLDILKWKTLVLIIQKISIKQAAIQSLAAHTGALLTPNRIGEYGIKAMYFNKKYQKKIVLLNLIHHMLQMLVTTVFGVIGLVYILKNFAVDLPVISFKKIRYLISFLVMFILMGRMVIRKKIRSFYWNKIIRFMKNMSKKTLVFAFLLSVLKYVMFVHQFIYLLYLFDVQFTYFEVLLILFGFYFVASILPSLPIFDWLVKGSVAIMLLQLLGIDEIVIITISTIMWLLNFALPAIIGSFFVLKFKKTTLSLQKK